MYERNWFRWYKKHSIICVMFNKQILSNIFIHDKQLIWINCDCVEKSCILLMFIKRIVFENDFYCSLLSYTNAKKQNKIYSSLSEKLMFDMFFRKSCLILACFMNGQN